MVEDEDDVGAMDWMEQEWATDGVTGGDLKANKVREARKEEIEYFRRMQVYDKINRKAADEGMKKAVATRWIDINKGDRNNEKYRSRLVAREFETYKR